MLGSEMAGGDVCLFLEGHVSVNAIRRLYAKTSRSGRRKWMLRVDLSGNDRHVLRVNGPSVHDHLYAHENGRASDYDLPVHVMNQLG